MDPLLAKQSVDRAALSTNAWSGLTISTAAPSVDSLFAHAQLVIDYAELPGLARVDRSFVQRLQLSDIRTDFFH